MKYCNYITIGGFNAIVDSNDRIIECDEEIKMLLYKNIKEVYQKYKHRTEFLKKKRDLYPLSVSEDKYNIMVKKNPAIALLREKFNCDIY